MVNALTSTCNKIWQKGDLQLCQNYQTVSLISHLKNIMLKVLLNRLQPQVEKFLLKSRQDSNLAEAPLNRYLNSEFCLKNAYNTNAICSMFSLILRKHSVWCGIDALW